MDSNRNTQHIQLCTTAFTKLQKVLAIQGLHNATLVAVALNMSKAFYTVNMHELIHELTLINIPTIIIKFIANYIKGRQACSQYNATLSKLKRINTGV